MNRRGETAAQQCQLSNSQTSSCFRTQCCSHNAVTDAGSWHTWSPPVAPLELETSCFCGHASTHAAPQEEEVFAYVGIASPRCTFTFWQFNRNAFTWQIVRTPSLGRSWSITPAVVLFSSQLILFLFKTCLLRSLEWDLEVIRPAWP